MLPLAALLLTQVAQPNLAGSFVAECSKAVLAIKEGVWRTEVETEGPPQMVETRFNGTRSLCRTSVDGQPYVDVALSRGKALCVVYVNRQYFEYNPPALQGKEPEPLPPLEYGSFDYKLEIPLGFVLRANPGWTGVKIVRGKDVETLTAKSVKKEGGALTLRLVRDAKTNLPKTLTYTAKGNETTIRFDCEARRVEDAELAIPPSVYAGFERIDPPSGTH